MVQDLVGLAEESDFSVNSNDQEYQVDNRDLYEERKSQLTSKPLEPHEYEAVIQQILQELGI